MPKRSKEDTEKTIQTILRAVEEQIITLGYDKMSYTTLSQQTGISRTGISHHFPKKTDFMASLEATFINTLSAPLNLTNGRKEFMSSWREAFRTSHAFKATLRLHYLHLLIEDEGKQIAHRTLFQLKEYCAEKLDKNIDEEFSRLLGDSLLMFGE